jgi:hypothetical protein
VVYQNPKVAKVALIIRTREIISTMLHIEETRNNLRKSVSMHPHSSADSIHDRADGCNTFA